MAIFERKNTVDYRRVITFQKFSSCNVIYVMSVTQGFVARQKWYGHGFQNISISFCPIATIFGLWFENTCGNGMTRAFSDILTQSEFFRR